MFLHLNRCHQIGIAADKGMIPDHGSMLFLPVIIHADDSASHIDLLPQVSIADIGQMGHLGFVTDSRILDLHKVSDPHMISDPAARPDIGIGSDGGRASDPTVQNHGGLQRRPVRNLCILQPVVGIKEAAGTKNRGSLQNISGINDRILPNPYVRADIGGGRVRNGNSPHHVKFIDPPAHLRFCPGQADTIGNRHDLPDVPDPENSCPFPCCFQNVQNILRATGLRLRTFLPFPDDLPQSTAVKAVYRRNPVAAGLRGLPGQNRCGQMIFICKPQHLLQRCPPDEGHVSGQYKKISAGFFPRALLHAKQATDGIPPFRRIHDPARLPQMLPNTAAVPMDHYSRPAVGNLPCRIHDIVQYTSSADRMQHGRNRRLHCRCVISCQNNGRYILSHTSHTPVILTFHIIITLSSEKCRSFLNDFKNDKKRISFKGESLSFKAYSSPIPLYFSNTML